jgi:hypothetical protein
VTDLKIDYGLLSETSRSLGVIYQAFDRLRSRTSHTESDWGSSDIARAMGRFSGDWDNHRHKIMKSVESLKRMTDEAAHVLPHTDSALAASLHQRTRSGAERAE